MDNPRPEKVAVVDEVKSKLQGAGAALVTEYRGLDVAATAQLRRSLTEAGGDYKIYKNTLVRFAARDLGLELGDLLTGPTAIAFVDGDPVAVAKALRDFARNNPALVVKGGILGDKTLDAAGVRSLADVEPREVLLAKLAGAMAAPMTQLAGLLQAMPRNLAYGLKALIDQGGAPGAPAPSAPPAEDAPSPDASSSSPAADAGANPTAPPADVAAAGSDAAESAAPESDAAESAAAESDAPESDAAESGVAAGSDAAESAAAGSAAAESAPPESAAPSVADTAQPEAATDGPSGEPTTITEPADPAADTDPAEPSATTQES